MYLFTSEVVSPGHPDKCADIIADSIVDRLIMEDPASRVASEVFVAGKNVIIGGEVTSNAHLSDAELDALPQVFSTEELKVETTEEEKFLIIDKVKELLKNPPSDFPAIVSIIDVDGVRINFEKGWGLVRASNTTPVLVTRFESTDEDLAKEYEIKVNALILQAKDLL